MVLNIASYWKIRLERVEFAPSRHESTGNGQPSEVFLRGTAEMFTLSNYRLKSISSSAS